MSFNFVVGQINTQLERIVIWYRDFMHRTEMSFKTVHGRLTRLEEQQAWRGPSDEQVERVLRKILAERFADGGVQRPATSDTMKDGEDTLVENSEWDAAIPYAIPIDSQSVKVDVNAMPNFRYAETLQMLEDKLPSFPNIDLSRTANSEQEQDDEDVKPPNDFKRFKLPPIKPQHGKAWS